MEPKIAIIDYEMGNLLSVRRAFEKCGGNTFIVNDPDSLSSATHVVLPGVGAFRDGMSELQSRGFDTVLREIAIEGKPLMGICLGMQMLMDVSEEFGLWKGLGLIRGRVCKISITTREIKRYKIPSVGWYETWQKPGGLRSCNNDIFNGIEDGVSFYFVHSYMAVPENPQHLLAEYSLGEIKVTAAIGSGRIFGCQFHPEKSALQGLRLIHNFISA